MKFRKTISLILAVVMALSIFTVGASASSATKKSVDFVTKDVKGNKNYTIENPYIIITDNHHKKSKGSNVIINIYISQ